MIGDEGDTASDVDTDLDDTPTGGLVAVLRISLHSGPVDATGRATLRAAAGGTDSQVRAAIEAVLGAGWAREEAGSGDLLRRPSPRRRPWLAVDHGARGAGPPVNSAR